MHSKRGTGDIFVLLILLLVTQGLTLGDSIRFDPLPKLTPLSDPRVHSVHCDTDGRMWFGTVKGLNCFDGHTMKNLRPGKDNQGNSGNFNAAIICEDASSGRLWIANSSSEIYCFDTNTEEFSTVSRPAPSEKIWAMHLRKNQLWIAADDGLSLLDLTSSSFTSYITEIPICEVFPANEDQLWLGTRMGQLMRFDIRTGDREIITLRDSESTSARSVRIVGGNANDLWIGVTGFRDGGLYHYDISSKIVTPFRSDPDDPNSLGDNNVKALHFDIEGKLWLGTRDGGLHLFNQSSRSFDRFTPEPGNDSSLPHVNITDLTSDRSGRIWVATEGGGVCHFDPLPQWSSIYDYSRSHHDLGFPGRIGAIVQSSNNIIWIASSRGIIQWNGESDTFVRYLGSESTPARLSGHQVTSLLASDIDGSLWIGYRDGLGHYDENAKVIRPIENFDAHVVAMAEHADTLWLGTDSGLLILNREKNAPILHEPTILTNPISVVYVSPIKDEIFVGTRKNGLVQMSGDGQITRHHLFDSSDSTSIPSDQINAVLIDSRGWTWVGTARGLCRYAESSDSWITVFPSDEFGNREVKTIGEDNDGNLWLGTESGIFRMADPGSRSPILHHYEELNGQRIGSIQAYSLIDEELQAFGNHKGIHLIDPSLWRDSPSPKIVFSRVRILAETRADSPQELNIRGRINHGQLITLQPEQTNITVDFSALDFEDIHRQRFSAKLEPFDDHFIDLENAHSVTYTNLPTGSYSLKIKGANGRGIWSTKTAMLKIKVLPHWWETWWFQIGAIAALITSIFAFYRLRTRRIREHNHQLAMEVKQRKEVQQILRGREQFIRIVTDHIPIFIAYVDCDETIQFSNNLFRQIFNLSKQEILGSTLEDVYGPIYEDRIAERATAALNGIEGTYLCELTTDDQDPRLYKSSYIPYNDSSGKVVGFFLLSEDITARTRIEQELQLRRDDLAHFSRVALVGEMTGAIAHEINQPLAGVSFQAQAARRLLNKQGDVDKDLLGEIIDDILNDNDRAGQIVKRLWNLYKNRSATQEVVDLSKVLIDTVELSRSERERHGLTLNVHLLDTPSHVSGDYVQLQQVFLNLLRNAQDATREAELPGELVDFPIELTVSQSVDYFIVAISDMGGGIPEKKRKSIFTPFETTKASGLGLGLAISKSIVDAHKGTIHVENENGRGATFFVRLPKIPAQNLTTCSQAS